MTTDEEVARRIKSLKTESIPPEVALKLREVIAAEVELRTAAHVEPDVTINELKDDEAFPPPDSALVPAEDITDRSVAAEPVGDDA